VSKFDVCREKRLSNLLDGLVDAVFVMDCLIRLYQILGFVVDLRDNPEVVATQIDPRWLLKSLGKLIYVVL